jgi:general secretion pathway protein D
MKKIILVLAIALGVWSCATISPQYRLGAKAEMNKQWEEAISYYEKASLENPKEPAYRLALMRAKIGASLFHLQEARRLAASGKKDEAKAEYVKALAFNPRDTAIAKEVQALMAPPPKEAEGKPEKIEFPIKLKTKEDKVELKVPAETSLRSIFLGLGKKSGISFVFDETFRDVPFTADFSEQTVEQTVRSLCLGSRNFYRIVDERTVLIIPDNPMKRMQYEVTCIKTFYLSNVAAQDMQTALSSMLRSTTKVPNIIFDKNLNSLTIRDTPQTVELAEKLIRIWDKAKGEVVIDLEIMEVSRLKLRQLGISFGDNMLGARYGGTDTTTDTSGSTTTTSGTGWFNLKSINFADAANFAISLPISYLQLLESDADTKIIAQPRLRGVSDADMKHLVGQKIPIPQTVFSPFAAGGIAQQPVTSFQQQDVGIDIKIKPTVHLEGDVTLDLEIKVTSLGGTGYADIPIISTREIKNTIRLKDGETNLLAGLLKDEERKSLKGIPGLMSIPILGRIFSSEDTTLEQTDVILTITPYIVRSVSPSAEDSKPLWVDVESAAAEGGGGGVLEDDLMGRNFDAREAQRLLQTRRQQDLGSNQILLSPANFEAPANQEIRIAVNVRSDQDIGNMSLTINYNPQQLNLKDVTEGSMGRQLGQKPAFLKNIDNNGGVCTIGFSSPEAGKGVKGNATLATLLFQTKNPGESVITVGGLTAISASGQAISLRTTSSRVVVR